jgi:hypothetical protein
MTTVQPVENYRELLPEDLSEKWKACMGEGLSTGPRTAAGKCRVGEAARQRAQRKKTRVV